MTGWVVSIYSLTQTVSCEIKFAHANSQKCDMRAKSILKRACYFSVIFQVSWCLFIHFWCIRNSYMMYIVKRQQKKFKKINCKTCGCVWILGKTHTCVRYACGQKLQCANVRPENPSQLTVYYLILRFYAMIFNLLDEHCLGETLILLS